MPSTSSSPPKRPTRVGSPDPATGGFYKARRRSFASSARTGSDPGIAPPDVDRPTIGMPRKLRRSPPAVAPAEVDGSSTACPKIRRSSRSGPGARDAAFEAEAAARVRRYSTAPGRWCDLVVRLRYVRESDPSSRMLACHGLSPLRPWHAASASRRSTVRRALVRGDLEGYRAGQRGQFRIPERAITEWIRPAAHDPQLGKPCRRPRRLTTVDY